jgi:DNA polymerase (family 10)
MELMNLPGIGLKTAQQVWKERGITDVDALEAAAKAGKLRDLPRFGQKREEKLVQSILAWRKRAAAPKRRLMSEALALAEALCARMREVPGVVRCEPAGSLRRRAETVGDLDILVAAHGKDAHAIMEAFATAPKVAEVLGKGDTKTSVVLEGGMQADMRVVPPDSWGAALQYFTGSKDHNVAMRTIAVKKGFKVSEYGVFDAGGAKIAGEDEPGVYAAIGLTWMEPELRENRGEIEASMRRALPELVQLDDVLGDLHMHTTETDGKSTLEAMAEGARAAGRKYIAITDHSESLTIARGMNRERLRAHVAKIRALDEALGGKVRVLAGVETDILADGALDLDDELRSLDWVVGSVHSHLGMPREEMTKRVVRAVESGKIDCLGHATGRQLGVREPSQIDLEAVLRALAKVGAAIELNSSPLRLDVTETWATMARELGVPVVVNSDAHSVRELGFLRYGMGIARRAWLERSDVLNTRSVGELRAWCDARR